jgi:hypothetical protein
MKRTHVGGCHCGAVRYEADLDLAAGTFKCNCSICTKARSWLAPVQPDSFRLLAGATELTEYLFGAKNIHHLFCKHCGVRPFSWGTNPDSGKFYVVNVMCLDDLDIDELVSAPIGYIDGRRDAWDSAPAERRHL